jgi:hypothetical protein
MQNVNQRVTPTATTSARPTSTTTATTRVDQTRAKSPAPTTPRLTQAAYNAAGKSGVGKTVDGSKAAQQVKQGIDQSDGGKVLQEGEGSLPRVKQEFMDDSARTSATATSQGIETGDSVKPMPGTGVNLVKMSSTAAAKIASECEVKPTEIRAIENNLDANGGVYTPDPMSEVSLPNHKISDITKKILEARPDLKSLAKGDAVTATKAVSAVGKTAQTEDLVKRHLFKQINSIADEDDNGQRTKESLALDKLDRHKFELLCLTGGGKYTPVKFQKVIPGVEKTCHEFAYDKLENSDFIPSCEDVLQQAIKTKRPYAVYFSDGDVAHSAFKDKDGTWKQALKTTHPNTGTATAIFSTQTQIMKGYDPILVFDPRVKGAEAIFRKAWAAAKATSSSTLPNDASIRSDAAGYVLKINSSCRNGDSSKAKEMITNLFRIGDNDVPKLVLNELLLVPQTSAIKEVIAHIQDSIA